MAASDGRFQFLEQIAIVSHHLLGGGLDIHRHLDGLAAGKRGVAGVGHLLALVAAQQAGVVLFLEFADGPGGVGIRGQGIAGIAGIAEQGLQELLGPIRQRQLVNSATAAAIVAGTVIIDVAVVVQGVIIEIVIARQPRPFSDLWRRESYVDDC